MALTQLFYWLGLFSFSELWLTRSGDALKETFLTLIQAESLVFALVPVSRIGWRESREW